MKYVKGNNGIYVDGKRTAMLSIFSQLFRFYPNSFPWYAAFPFAGKSLIIYRHLNYFRPFGIIWVSEKIDDMSQIIFIKKMAKCEENELRGLEMFLDSMGYYFRNREDIIRSLNDWMITVNPNTMVVIAKRWVEENPDHFEI